MSHPEEHRLMMAEWRAWQVVVQEWRRVFGDMNDERCCRLVSAILCWGESLVALRLEQPQSIRENAARDEAARFARLVEKEVG